MKETQLKQINKQPSNLKPIQNTPTNKQQIKQVKQPKYETINSLPTWSIEPPLEIKRGN